MSLWKIKFIIVKTTLIFLVNYNSIIINKRQLLKLSFFVTLLIMLKGKKILLGITGSIAAYKAIYLFVYLVTAGAEVKIIMTPAPKILYLLLPCQHLVKIRFWLN